MIPRYTRPGMGDIWTEEHKWTTMLRVLIAVLDARFHTDSRRLGRRPIFQSALKKLRRLLEKGLTPEDVRRIEEIEKTTQHDVGAFLDFLVERVKLTRKEAAVYAQDLTSYDLQDTGLSLQIQESCKVLRPAIERLMTTIKVRALEHQATPQIGRTHGMHGEPITFGWKLLGWYASLDQLLDLFDRAVAKAAVGKVSGAMGVYALPPEVERMACRDLGLTIAIHSTQILPRAVMLNLFSVLVHISGEVERYATEIRNLQRPEIGEVMEFFAKDQRGSTAMPHKRNPIGSENATGAARLMRGYYSALLQCQATWHERDISNSVVERLNIPDMFILLDYQLNRFSGIVEKMLVNPERMKKNLELTNGVVFSRWLRTALENKGMPRQEAYELVQELAFRAYNPRTGTGEGHLRDLAKADKRLHRRLTDEEIDACFDPEPATKHIEGIFYRVIPEDMGKRDTL